MSQLAEAVRALIAANNADSRVYMLTAAQEAAWSRVQSELAAAEAQPALAEDELVPLEMHNLLTAGPAPWTATRVPSELWHVARAVYGTSSEDDEKRVYRTVQSALWMAASLAAPVAAAQPDSLVDKTRQTPQTEVDKMTETLTRDLQGLVAALYAEADKCEMFNIDTPAKLLREAAAVIQPEANAQTMGMFAEVVSSGNLADLVDNMRMSLHHQADEWELHEELCGAPCAARLREIAGDHKPHRKLPILPPDKPQRVHAIVNAGHFPGMSDAFDAHMGAECWTDPVYAPDASTWAAAWKAAKAQPESAQPATAEDLNVYDAIAANYTAQPVAVPQGATHYQPHQKTYYQRVSATEWRLWSDRYGWMPSKGTSDSSQWVTLEPIAAAPALCACKDRPASACPCEWEPGCDLGNNEAHCVAAPAPQPLKPLTLEQICDLEAGCGHLALDWDTRISIVRAVEAAHGIKGAA